MKKKILYHIFVFLSLFLFTGKAFAEIHFEITPLYSLKNGCLNELVFYNTADEWYKLSELNWNIKNISYLGGNIAVGSKYIRLDAGFVSGFSKASAKMYDSDWQNLPDAPDMKTTFSISENTLDSNITFNTKATFSFNITNCLKAGMFAKYTFDQIRFSARNGYGWYGSNRYSQNGQNVPYDSEYAKFFGSGSLQGIDYFRRTNMFDLGFLYNFTLFNRVQLNLEASFSPFASVKSLDHHYSASGSESYYRDEIKLNLSIFELGANLRVQLWQNLYLGCAFSYNYISEQRGDTWSKSESHGYTDMIFKDLDEYFEDTTSKSGCSGQWYTITAYCSYVF